MTDERKMQNAKELLGSLKGELASVSSLVSSSYRELDEVKKSIFSLGNDLITANKRLAEVRELTAEKERISADNIVLEMRKLNVVKKGLEEREQEIKKDELSWTEKKMNVEKDITLLSIKRSELEKQVRTLEATRSEKVAKIEEKVRSLEKLKESENVVVLSLKQCDDVLGEKNRELALVVKKIKEKKDEIAQVSEEHARTLTPLSEKIERIKKEMDARFKDLMIYEARVKRMSTVPLPKVTEKVANMIKEL